MPTLWVTSIEGSVVTLNDGRTFDLSTVPGNGFNQNRLQKINDKIQAQVDVRTLRTDLPLDDPDRTIDPDTPRRFWGDADGTKNPAGDYVIARVQEVWLTFEPDNPGGPNVLIPHARNV